MSLDTITCPCLHFEPRLATTTATVTAIATVTATMTATVTVIVTVTITATETATVSTVQLHTQRLRSLLVKHKLLRC